MKENRRIEQEKPGAGNKDTDEALMKLVGKRPTMNEGELAIKDDGKLEPLAKVFFCFLFFYGVGTGQPLPRYVLGKRRF